MQNVTSTIPETVPTSEEIFLKALQSLSFDIRVAMPGIVQEFYSNNGVPTVTVQLALRENISINGNLSWKQIPPLVDVPVFMQRSGGYVSTMPITKGDECLVIFGDCCIDAWWQSGGVQNQADNRRHDLSDGFAIVGFWSKPRAISNYSTNSAQLRTEDGNTVIDLKPGTITHTATNVVINSNNVMIAGKDFLSHEHSGVQAGSGNTGIVT